MIERNRILYRHDPDDPLCHVLVKGTQTEGGVVVARFNSLATCRMVREILQAELEDAQARAEATALQGTNIVRFPGARIHPWDGSLLLDEMMDYAPNRDTDNS